MALVGDPDYVNESIVAMDRWLAAVERDKRKISLARKIIEDKPADLVDRCSDGRPGGSDVLRPELRCHRHELLQPADRGGHAAR